MSEETHAAHDSAADRVAVHDVMYRYALAVDTKDWSLLGTVFAENLTADFRSFGSKKAFKGTRTEWVEQVKATIAGMDATQHLMANPLFTVEGDAASGTMYIQALHQCRNDWGGDVYTIGGRYEVNMRRGDGGWRITDYALHVSWHSGDRHVLRAAARRLKG